MGSAAVPGFRPAGLAAGAAAPRSRDCLPDAQPQFRIGHVNGALRIQGAHRHSALAGRGAGDCRRRAAGAPSMSRVRGFTFALGSVGLVSAAQLGMRWSMTRLPLPDEWLGAFSSNGIDLGALGVVMAAILAYALSMLCWLLALRDLPLGRAYSLLSISYALVYLMVASLPVFNEHFSLAKSLGVALVILGVITINSRPARAPVLRNTP